MHPPAGPEAHCQVHPGVAAAFTCVRCGSFACDACRSGPSPGRCQACAARATARLGQDVSAVGLLRDTFGLLGPCLPALGVVTLVTWLFELLMAYGIRPPFEHLGPGGTQPPLGFNIVERLFWMVLKAATSAGFIRWLADGILQEEPRTLARVLKVALAGAFLLALQQLLSLFMVGLATLLVILPGIYLATSLSLASAAFVVDGLGPIAALQRSMAVVQGHWLRLFLALTPLFVLNAAIVLLTQQLPVLLGQEGDAERLATSVLSTAVATTTYGLLEIATVLAYLRLTRRPAPEPPPVPVEAPPASTEA